MVVVIMGIASAIVVPQMLRGGQMGLQAAARMVIADVIFAQNEAVAHQAVRRVVFDAANDSYRITDGAGNTLTASWKANGGAGENYIVSFADDGRFQGVVMENVDIGGGAVLEFDALGSPVNGGTLEMATADFRYRIAIAPFTGQVTIGPVAGE